MWEIYNFSFGMIVKLGTLPFSNGNIFNALSSEVKIPIYAQKRNVSQM